MVMQLCIVTVGGMAYGSCGKEFRDAFSCFHYSKEDPKGSNCVDSFVRMHNCFQEYPEEYGKFADDEDEDNIEESKDNEEIEHKEGKTKESRDDSNEKHSKETLVPSLSQPINSSLPS